LGNLRQAYGYHLTNKKMITHILALLVGFVAGALVMRKHKAKADSLEAKGRQALDALKGRE